jgi:hypothetical protein
MEHWLIITKLKNISFIFLEKYSKPISPMAYSCSLVNFHGQCFCIRQSSKFENWKIPKISFKVGLVKKKTDVCKTEQPTRFGALTSKKVCELWVWNEELEIEKK